MLAMAAAAKLATLSAALSCAAGWGAGFGIGTQYINVSPEFTEGKQHRCEWTAVSSPTLGADWGSRRLYPLGWLPAAWPTQAAPFPFVVLTAGFLTIARAAHTALPATLPTVQAKCDQASSIPLEAAVYAAEHARWRLGSTLIWSSSNIRGRTACSRLEWRWQIGTFWSAQLLPLHNCALPNL